GGGTGKGGSLARFAIVNNNLFVLTDAELKSYDINNGATPQFVQATTVNTIPETIFPLEDYLYLGTPIGMYIYRINEEGVAQYVSEYQHVVSCDPVVTDGTYAYVTLNSRSAWCGRNTNELQVLDITDKTNIKIISSIDMYSPLGMGIKDNLLFVCDDGLKVYDRTSPNDMALTYHFKDITASDVIPYKDVLIVTGSDGINQYQVKNGLLAHLSSIHAK
ncbi:MAG: hypothetical protein MI922_26400, partial [Bacteroidales bacterium]|nr:hypothetical protein [Bacteroidales bacterium]